MSMKNSNDTIENRTRDLPVCNAVPQPTASPRTSCKKRQYPLVTERPRGPSDVFPYESLHYTLPHSVVLYSQCLRTVIELTGFLPHEQMKQKGCPQPRDVPSCCLITCGLLISISPCQLLPLLLLCLSSSKTTVWTYTGY